MGILLLLVALCISAIAAFYSVAGLAAIFSGAVVAVVIMGSCLELAKIITAAWLHQNWKTIPLLLKTYLTFAVIVLMIITSIGIFGFLSKAHVEQEQRQAALQTSYNLITEQQSDVDANLTDAKQRLAELQSNDSFDKIRSRIETEQESLTRIEADKTESTYKINADIAVLQADIDSIKQLVGAKQVSEVQQILGLRPDGEFGSSTKAALAKYVEAKETKIKSLTEQIAGIENKTNTLYNQTSSRIDSLQAQISNPEQAKQEISTLSAKISALEGEQQSLATALEPISIEIQQHEVEVGPITFISELFFGSANEDNARATIQILIFIIIVVFDPLAILLIIAASMSITKSVEEEPIDDKLPTSQRIKELISVQDNNAVWKERDDKAFNSRWAGKPLGIYATIDGRRYKTSALIDKIRSK